MSWLEFIGAIAIVIFACRILVTVFPPTTETKPQSTRPHSSLESYEELEATIAAEQRAIEKITDEYYDSLSSTAMAAIYEDQANTAVAELTHVARLQEPNCPHWSLADDYIGEETCIYGDVYSTYDSGSAFFINFTEDRTAFYAVSFIWYWEELEDQCVIIYGTIETYQGRPQIVIEDREQVQSCYQ